LRLYSTDEHANLLVGLVDPDYLSSRQHHPFLEVPELNTNTDISLVKEYTNSTYFTNTPNSQVFISPMRAVTLSECKFQSF